MKGYFAIQVLIFILCISSPIFGQEEVKDSTQANISTRWLGFDIAINEGIPILVDTDFVGTNRVTGKIGHFGLNIFRQRINLFKHKLNIDYGFGIYFDRYDFTKPYVYYNRNQIFTSPSATGWVTGTSKIRLRVVRFEVPVMVNYTFMPGKRFSPHITAGGFLNINLGEKWKFLEPEVTRGEIFRDFDVRDFSYGLRAEIGAGPITLFSTYNFRPFFYQEDFQIFSFREFRAGIRIIPFWKI